MPIAQAKSIFLPAVHIRLVKAENQTSEEKQDVDKHLGFISASLYLLQLSWVGNLFLSV